MSRREFVVLASTSIVAAAALSLVGLGSRRDPPRGEPFIVFARDFDGFDRWESFDIPANAGAASAHAQGPRTVYLNKRPSPTDTRFPVGTMIVKVIRIGDRTDWPVFAMVKRGGLYNRGGAPGWEWFQLALDGGAVRIQWRGIGPPSPEAGYGSGVDCSQCHMECAAGNDAVQADVLDMRRLSTPFSGAMPSRR